MTISGAKKPGLPQKSPSFLPLTKVEHRPKSQSLTSKRREDCAPGLVKTPASMSLRRMFSGLRSRWQMPWEWQ